MNKMVSVCQQIESNNQDFNHGSVFCQHKWVLWVEFGLFSHVNVAEHDISFSFLSFVLLFSPFSCYFVFTFCLFFLLPFCDFFLSFFLHSVSLSLTFLTKGMKYSQTFLIVKYMKCQRIVTGSI